MRRALALAVVLAGAAACQPTFERRPSQVDGKRILAVQSTPAEAKPGAPVTLRALLVDESGPLGGPAPGWAFCVQGRPAADYNTVSQRCLANDVPYVRPFFSGADPFAADALLPSEGCAVFGSEPLPPKPGEQPTRAADPDGTGGYYQPVRVAWPGADPVAFGQVRLSCALPSAPAAAAFEFRDRYRANQNPALGELSLEGGVSAVSAGAQVRLSALADPADLEAFVAYDLKTSTVQDRVEALTVAWFGTRGRFEVDATPMAERGVAVVGWTAPDEPGPASLWAVLRDDRGGVAWRQLAVEVR